MATMTTKRAELVERLDKLVAARAHVNLLMHVNFVPDVGDNMFIDVKGTLGRYYTAGHYVVLIPGEDAIYFPVDAVAFLLEGDNMSCIKMKDGWFSR